MQERMHFSIRLGGREQWHQSRSQGRGLAIFMLGAFDGREDEDNVTVDAPPSLHPVDIDTLNRPFEKIHPSIDLSLDEDPHHTISFRFTCLDDFHPDRLLDHLAAYLSTADPAPVVAEDRRKPRLQSADTGSTETETEQDTLSRLLGDRPLSAEQGKRDGATLSGPKKSMLEAVVRRIAENASETHATESGGSQKTGDDNIQDQARLLKNLLHDKAFQRLEANWRAVDWLIHSIEPDPAIHFYILNISRSDLAQTRLNHEIPATSPLYHLLRDRYEREGLTDCDLIFIDEHHYGLNQDDIAALDWLGSLVGHFNGRLLAAADSSFTAPGAGPADTAEAWREFRQRPPSTRIALLYPQVLLRLPYGSKTDPIQGFDFEELDETWHTDELLWGNPAYAALILTIRRWMELGDGEQASLLTDLPAYTYKCEGEYQLQPCTKSLLRKSEIDQLLNLGLVPVIGSRNSNTIQIPWYQHIGSNAVR